MIKILGITGSWDGFVPVNGVIYNRGAWGGGYSFSWFSSKPSSSPPTITQNQSSIDITNVYDAPNDVFATVLFGNARQTILLDPWSKITIIMRSVYSYLRANMSFTIYSSSGAYLAGASVVATENIEYTLSASLVGVNGSGYLSFISSQSNTSAFRGLGFTIYSIILS